MNFKSKHLSLCAVIILFLSGSLYAQPKCPDWQWATSGGSGGTFESATGEDLVTDPSGYTYITGTISGTARFGNKIIDGNGIFVTKVNSLGQYQWVATAEVGGVEGIDIDNNGALYIVGSFYQTAKIGATTLTSVTEFGTDIYVAKIDTAGNWQWAVSGGGSSNDKGEAIAVDNNGIYITGSNSSNATFGTFTIPNQGPYFAKLNSSGSWEAAKNISSSIQFVDMVTDKAGGFYLTGYTNQSGSSYTYLLKLNDAGNTQWTQSLGTTGNRVIPQGMTYGNSGIYITGYFSGTLNTFSSKGGYDIFVSAFNTSGQPIKTWAEGGAGDDKGQAVYVDAVGNMILAAEYSGTMTIGSTNLTTSNNRFVAQYSGSAWKWVHPARNIVFTAISSEGKGFFLSTGTFYLNAVFGNKYINGTSSQNNMFTAAVSQSGWQWAYSASEGISNRHFNISKSTVDEAGNSYFTGQIKGVFKFGDIEMIVEGPESYKLFVAKMDANGEWKWVTTTGSGYSTTSAISADKDGNIYVGGSFSFKDTIAGQPLASNWIESVFVAKLNSSGQWQWVASGEGGGAPGLAIDAFGNTLVTGAYNNGLKVGNFEAPGKGLYVAKLNTAGQWQWMEKATTASSGFNTVTAINTDASGNGYLAGIFSTNLDFGSLSINSSKRAAYVAKITSSGVWEWAEAPATGDISVASLSISNSGKIFLTGWYLGTAQFGSNELSPVGNGDIFVACLDAVGKPVWASKAGSTSTSGQDIGQFIVTDAQDNAYIYGQCFNGAAFGSKTITVADYYSDVFVAKISGSGNWLWAINPTNKNNSEYAFGFGLDKTGNIYISGRLYGDLSFGPITVPMGGNGLFVAKLKEVPMIANAGQAQTIGCGDQATLNGSAQGYASFSWSPTTGLTNSNTLTPTAAPIATTTYTLTAVNACGESVTSSVTVTVTPFPITVSAQNTNINCGDFTQLNVTTSYPGQLTYSWSPVSGLDDPSLPNPTAKPAYNTTYSVTVTAPNGCKTTGEVTISVNNPNPPAVGLSSSTGEKFFCTAGQTLEAAPGFASYLWNTGETTPSIVPTQPGTYSVEVINHDGCGNRDSITLEVPTKITAPDGFFFCEGQQGATVRLDAGEGFDSYLWSNGQQTRNISVTQPGNYSVTVTRGSCQYTTSATVMNHPGTTNANFTTEMQALTVKFIPFTQGIRFLDWDFGDSKHSADIVATHTYAQPGTYEVCLELTDYCGYTAKQCKSIYVSGQNAVREVTKAVNILEIYPNPATSTVTIKTGTAGRKTIKVTDLTGRSLIEDVSSDSQMTLDISSFAKGVYMITVDQITQKLIVQ